MRWFWEYCYRGFFLENEIRNINGIVFGQTITVPTAGQTPGFTATQTYTYDALNRIKQATETIPGQTGWQQTFGYDRYGNRRFETANNATTTLDPNCPVAVCNPQIDPNTNKLIGYTFDATGNTTVDAEGRSFIYDAENKQVRVKDPQNNTVGAYVYDGDGRRIKKHVPSAGELTVFVYDAAGKLIGEYSTIAESQSPKVSYTTSDHLGSPRILTDENGSVISRRDFHPFGEEIARQQYGSDLVRQKFTGYERDNETDLDFAQARIYAFSFGRFTSPDNFLNDTHVSDPQSWNLYVYVRNNPLLHVDPSGEEIRKKADGTVDFRKTDDKQHVQTTVLGTREVIVNGNKEIRTIKAVATMNKGKIFSVNNGNEIEIDAFQQDVPLQIVETNEKGETTFSGTVSAFKDYSGSNELDGFSSQSNCHGTTFANGEVWIDNDQVKKLMKAEGYDVANSSATPSVGAVGIFSTDGNLSNTRHSVTVSRLNPTMVLSKGGIRPKETTTPADSWSNKGEGRETHKQRYYIKKVTE